MDVQYSDLAALLGAFRAILSGTTSPQTRPVPPVVAGYFSGPVGRRPLGEVRKRLNRQVGQAHLDQDALDLVRLSYGLDLLVVPISGRTGTSLAEQLPAVPKRLGRPRAQRSGKLGDGPARHLRSKALKQLVSTWSPSQSQLFRPSPEPHPLHAGWYREAAASLSLVDKQFQLRHVLAVCRELVSQMPGSASLLLDLDWWAFQNRLEPFAETGLGRPLQRINRERFLRAQSYFAIVLWSVLRDEGLIRFGDLEASESVRRYMRSWYTRGNVLDSVTSLDRIRTALPELIFQRRQSTTAALGANLVASASPEDIGALPGRLRLEAAAAMARVASEHKELGAAATRWLARCRPPADEAEEILIASACVDLSVAASAYGRFAEASAILQRAALLWDLHANLCALSLLALAESAWRRRLISAAIRHRRGISRDRLSNLVADCIAFARHATNIAPVEENPEESSLTLRCAIRLSESISVATHASAERLINADAPFAKAVERHSRVVASAIDIVERRVNNALATNYDTARLRVLERTHHLLVDGVAPLEFMVLSEAVRCST